MFNLNCGQNCRFFSAEYKEKIVKIHFKTKNCFSLFTEKMIVLYCRYATQIVLSVDAILITGEERQKTLNELSAPAAIEFYFFLQAWFQAIPQALFQSHLCFRDNVEGKTIQSRECLSSFITSSFFSLHFVVEFKKKS